MGTGTISVNLTKRVQLPEKGWRFCPVVRAKNGRLKPDYVQVDGEEQYHEGGAYYLDWSEAGKRIRRPAGKDATGADNQRRKQQAILAAQANGVRVVAEPEAEKDDSRLVVNAVNAYLEEVKLTKKKKTYVAYKTALDYFLESCHKQYLDDIDRKDLVRYAAYLRDEKKLAARTVNVKFGYLTTFLKAQGIVGLAKKNDWPRYVESEPEVYSAEELEKFFKACDDEQKMYFQFFLKTGMREQEMMHVTWNNVNLGAATVSVRANEQHGFLPKTYEEREIPIPDSLVQMLQAWKTKSNQACPLVFPTKGCKPKNDFLSICKAIALRAGVNCGHCQNVLNGKTVSCKTHAVCDHWFLHKFRATFCTWHLWSGNDLRTVQSWMGHRDIESTMRYLKPNRTAAVRDKVNSTFPV